MKMDHHCPWINNCCGHRNQAFFVQFLFFAVIGCIHALFILGPSLYRAIFRVWYIYYGTGREPIVELGLYGLFSTIFALGMAVGVVVSVGFLFCVQMRTILRNRTGIEDYIVAKAEHRDRDDTFIYPYNVGWKKNFWQVFTWDGEPESDGFTWTVVDGCDQYTFTVEQIQQKLEKREHSRVYLVVDDYDGSKFLAFRKHGCKVYCCQPMTEEARLRIKAEDRVLVTRWRRHWLYGEVMPTDVGGDAQAQVVQKRGWFPRRTVVEEVDPEEEVGEEEHVKSE